MFKTSSRGVRAGQSLMFLCLADGLRRISGNHASGTFRGEILDSSIWFYWQVCESVRDKRAPSGD
jgi:hypothetical protein